MQAEQSERSAFISFLLPQIRQLSSDGVITMEPSLTEIFNLDSASNFNSLLYCTGISIRPKLSIFVSIPFIFLHLAVISMNMITLCLYNVKRKLYIMLLKCYRGVIMATNKIQTGIRFEPELL